jgi:hypothetical protein
MFLFSITGYYLCQVSFKQWYCYVCLILRETCDCLSLYWDMTRSSDKIRQRLCFAWATILAFRHMGKWLDFMWRSDQLHSCKSCLMCMHKDTLKVCSEGSRYYCYFSVIKMLIGILIYRLHVQIVLYICNIICKHIHYKILVAWTVPHIQYMN